MSQAESRNERDPTAAGVLRLRGLPWDATKENVQRFLSPIAQVDAEDIMLVRNLRGDAYAIMREADAMQKAGTLHRQKIENRYVEVFRSSMDEYFEAREYVEHKMHCDRGYMCGLHVYGLPEDVSEAEVLEYFGAYDPADDGAHILVDEKRRPTGEALILYKTEADTNLAYHKQKNTVIRGHTVRLSVCSRGEVYDTVNKDLSKFVKPGYIHTRVEMYQGVVRLKGVPLKTSVQAIMQALPANSKVHEAMVMVPSTLLVRRGPDQKKRAASARAVDAAAVEEPAAAAAAAAPQTEDAFIVMDSEGDAAALAQRVNSIRLGDVDIEVQQTEMLEVVRAIGCCGVFLRYPDAKLKNVIRIHHLPHSVQRQHVEEFFRGFQFGEFGPVILTARDGRTCIGAFVEFASEAEATAAYEACKDKQFNDRTLSMQPAYKSAIYVCQPLSERSRDHVQFRSGAMTCMRVKGIPFEAEDHDVNDFFAGLTVIGLLMCTQNGKKTGEAYVEFATLIEVLKGYARNRGSLGNRYLDLCPVHKQEALTAANLMTSAEPARAPPERAREREPSPLPVRRRRSPSPRRSPEYAKRPYIEPDYPRRSDSRDHHVARGAPMYVEQPPLRAGNGYRGDVRPISRSPPRDRGSMRRSRSRSRPRSRSRDVHRQPARFDDRMMHRDPYPTRRASPSPHRRGSYPPPMYDSGRDARYMTAAPSRYPSPPRQFDPRDYRDRGRGDSRSRDVLSPRDAYSRSMQHPVPEYGGSGRDRYDDRDRFGDRDRAMPVERERYEDVPRRRVDSAGFDRMDRMERVDGRSRDNRAYPAGRADLPREGDRRFDDGRRTADFRGDYRGRDPRSLPRSPPRYPADRYPPSDVHSSHDRGFRRDVPESGGRDDRHMARRDELLSGGLTAERGSRR